MLSKVGSWFSLAMYENEEDRRVARVLLGLVLSFLLGGGSILVIGWLWGTHTYTLVLIIGCLSQLLILTPLFRGNLSAANYAVVVLYTFSITMSATVGKGIRDYAIMAYPVIIVFAGLAEQQRGLIISTSLIFTSLIWLIYGEISGWFITHPTLTINWLDLLITSTIIAFVALEVNMLVTNLKDRLSQIHRELVERKRAEDALSQSREMYRLLAEKISDVIWIFDINENHTRYISPSVERLRGYTADEVLAKDMSAALTPASLQDVQTKIDMRVKAFQAGSHDSYTDELEQLCKDGSTVWTEVTSSFHINKTNGHLEMYGVSRNIAERKRNERLLKLANDQLQTRTEEIGRLQEELHEQAIRDSLTGLYNRRYMQDVVVREFSRAARENYPLSILMLDMDELKLLNDTYGHHIGDQAIQVLATCLKNMIRVGDVACRYGGDEFTVIMSKTTAADALKRVKEWRKFLAAHPMDVNDQKQVQIKFTAGIANFPAHSKSMEEIINYADIALYRGKARGRNCTVVFE